MKCKYTKQGANDFYDEHINNYEEARDYEFRQQFMQEFNIGAIPNDLTYDDIQGFLDSFTFPDEEEWLASEYESHLGECADQAYMAWKERDI